MKNIFVITLVVLAALSCEKKPYPKNVVTGEAAFSFTGTVDGAAVTLEAGKDGYYLYSAHEAAPPVSSFDARFAKSNCNNCAPELSIKIYNTDSVAQGESILKPGSLAPGRRSFTNGLSVFAQFSAEFNRAAASYEWDFGDGSKGTGQITGHTYAVAGTYDVCLKITGQNGCISQICNTYEVSENGLRAYITSEYAQNAILFSNSTSGTPPFVFEWNFGNGTTSTEPSPLHKYLVEGSYPVTLTVKDGTGRTTVSRYNAVTQGDQSSCAANIRLLSVSQTDPLPFGNVIVSWKDVNGRAFTSTDAVPGPNDYFEIVSVEDYEANENGARTKRITVRLNCSLSDGSRTIRIDNGRAIIGVSYN